MVVAPVLSSSGCVGRTGSAPGLSSQSGRERGPGHTALTPNSRYLPQLVPSSDELPPAQIFTQILGLRLLLLVCRLFGTRVNCEVGLFSWRELQLVSCAVMVQHWGGSACEEGLQN